MVVWVTLAQPAQAWTGWGHETVALLAYRSSSPEVRRWLDRVLAQHPDPGARTVEGASTWPDSIRRSRPETRVWHYSNQPLGSGPAEPLNPHNVVWAIRSIQARLVRERGPQQAEDLAFLIHFVADVHQPLHAVNYHDSEFPAGDAGGNRLRLRRSLGGNFHAFWDRAGGRRHQDPDKLLRILETEHPRAQLAGPLTVRDPGAWAAESHHLAELAYRELDRDELPGLSQAYVKHARAVTDLRLALAGYRLADLLTRLHHDLDLLGGKKP